MIYRLTHHLSLLRQAIKYRLMESSERFFLFLVGLSLIICILYIPFWVLTENYYQAWINGFCALAYGATIYLICKNYPERLYLYLFTIVGVTNLATAALFNYPYTMSFLVWLMVQPISSFYFFTRREAGLLSLITFCIILLIPSLSAFVPQKLDWSGDFIRWIELSNYFCVLIYIVMMGYYYSYSIESKSVALEQKHTRLKQATSQLQENEKVKNKFIADLNHELRTPLNAILGIARIFKVYAGKPEDIGDLLGQLESSSEHLLKMINEVLDLSKINAGTLRLENEPFSLKELVDNVVAIMHPLADAKGLQLHSLIDSQLQPWYLGDAKRITQILINLMGNAIKFTPHGSITLKAHLCKTTSGQLQFEVEDTGIGIRTEHIEHIFDEFNQGEARTHMEYGGAGLGLHISKQFITLMEGTIWCESQIGQGSRFIFTLPLQAHQPPSDKTQVLDLQNELNTKCPELRILVVDDNKVNLYVTKKLIQSHLATPLVDTLENPTLISDAMVRNKYHIMLLDLNVPGHDMTEVSLRLKKDFPNCPLVAHTADSTFLHHQNFKTHGFDAVLIKPFEINDLYQILYSLLCLDVKPENQLNVYGLGTKLPIAQPRLTFTPIAA